MYIATLLTLLASPAQAQGLTVSGSCAGEVTAAIDGLTPGGRFAVVSGMFGGDHQVPVGACTGTELDLSGLEAVAISTAGPDGRFTASPRLGCGACEDSLQVVDLSTCTVSRVVHIPGSCEDDHDLYVRPVDYDTFAPLVDAEITIGDAIYWTDADGLAIVPLELEAPAQLVIEAPGYPVHRIERLGSPYVGSSSPAMLTQATIDLLGYLFGVAIDPAQTVVSVNVYAYDPVGVFANVEGVTVSLDVPYDLALAVDAASPYGLSVGATTLAGSAATVSFANVTPGPARLSLDLPDGYDCRWQKDLDLRPGERTVVTAICNEPR